MICVQPSYGNPIEAKPCALAIQPSPVSPIAKVVPAPLSAGALESLDPDDVNHVMVATRVIDSEEKVTLRTANGRYLAADQLGAVSAEQEARGPQEEWLLEPISQLAPIPDQPSGSAASPDPAQESSPDGLFALKSCLYNKYLTVEELANGKLDIRCDSDSPTDECSHILVRMQAVELVKAKKRLADERAKKGLSAKSNDSGLTILKPGQSFRDLEANNVSALLLHLLTLFETPH
jgi:protein FRG1